MPDGKSQSVKYYAERQNKNFQCQKSIRCEKDIINSASNATDSVVSTHHLLYFPHFTMLFILYLARTHTQNHVQARRRINNMMKLIFLAVVFVRSHLVLGCRSRAHDGPISCPLHGCLVEHIYCAESGHKTWPYQVLISDKFLTHEDFLSIQRSFDLWHVYSGAIL